MKYIIGTRGSKLALIQAEYVKDILQKQYPDDSFELKIIKTSGDKNQKDSLYKIGGKGIFVQEIEEQLLNDEIQIAVHSMKDMPSDPKEGLIFTKCLSREDARDVLVLREKKSLDELPLGATIATGSIRRKMFLLNKRPDLQIVDIRGNVDTRLRKMEELKLDGLVLAAAGLHRLGMQDVISEYLSYDDMLPSPGQGCLGIEINAKNSTLNEMIDVLSDEETTFTASVERLFLKRIHADCQTPVGAICEKLDDKYSLKVALGKNGKLDVVEVFGENGVVMVEEAISKLKKGKVVLVGAGCGDKDLITVKGLKCIQKADCIVYDRLVDPELLKEAKEGCELIYVGKENKNHTLPQREINELLMNKALIHSYVVRLKGGDPYVFGRGGEEVELLLENGIDFEVVPGITSSIAGLASAGIPITHRDFVSGFRVITAHNRHGNMDHIDFDSIVHSDETAVFLMGLNKLEKIVSNLLKAGMNSDMDIVVVSHAYMPDQKTIQGNLNNIVERVCDANITSPAVIAVGRTISFRNKYKRFLVTKAGEISELTFLLKEKGYRVDEIQLGKIKYLDFTLNKQYKYIIFTSKNGVEGFFKKEMDLKDAKIIAIGKKCQRVIEKKGCTVDFVSQGNSVELINDLKTFVDKKDDVLYVRAKEVSSDLCNELKDYCVMDEVIVYENEEIMNSKDLNMDDYDGIFFTCASSVHRFMKYYTPSCSIYSIGPCCSKACIEHGLNPIEAKKSNYKSMVESI